MSTKGGWGVECERHDGLEQSSSGQALMGYNFQKGENVEQVDGQLLHQGTKPKKLSLS